MHDFVSIVAILQRHAKDYPDQVAVKFLTQKGYEILTYSELDKKSRMIAEVLQQADSYLAARAVILLQPGLDYLVAFLGCLYAGVIAVPVYPPRKNQHADRVFAIIEDSQAAFVITNQILTEQFSNYNVINIDTIDAPLSETYKPIQITPDQVAFFQYTSGSTNTPKGVLITHLNIMTNLKVIQDIFPGGEGHKVGSWLPPYHDMGLIGCILCPLFMRTELILMPPAYFLQSPIRWLEVISTERITMTATPNFAFDLCVEKVTDEQLNNLDLSSLQCIYNGSEPIRYDSIQRFLKTFSRTGFSPRALYSCYGLAEATLMLTVKQYDVTDNSLLLNKADFELGKVVAASESNQSTLRVNNCGRCQVDHTIKIVDPKTLKEVPELTVGEIWASGPSIAKGYWNRQHLTESTFGNQLTKDKVNYLRTNDLGFIHRGELYVTGRINDLMIIRGRNYYPQDLEQIAMQSHPAFEFQRAAAFTIVVDGMPQLVLLQEVKRDALRQIDADKLFLALRAALLDQGLSPHAMVLLKPYSLPKTSSGKIRRAAARTAFSENTLNGVAYWHRDKKENHKSSDSLSLEAMHLWLTTWLKQHLQISLSDDDYEKTIIELGINSITAVELSNEIEHKLGKSIELLSLFEQCSLNQLITILTEQSSLISAAPKDSLTRVSVTTRDSSLVEPGLGFGLGRHDEQVIANLKTIYLNVNEGISSNTTLISGQQYTNYSGYNYLGLSGDPVVMEAVITAVKQFGTSVSASRLVSGEKSLHGELEQAIANLIGVEDCLALPSGYSTNVTILTHLFGKNDLIIHDELAHNSILQGALFSGAHRIAFPHNNYQFLTEYLEKYREQYKKVLIVTEGIFSMDGDIPDIKKLISIKKQFNAYMMIDEAHSMGVLGEHGKGIREYYNLDAKDIDIWMGTLSKSFASCGGYVAGSHELIENFKYTAAGFVYSAGMSPANTAAALAAIQVMNQEPERIQRLKARHTLLLSLLKQQNIPTGLSGNTPIIPIVVGEDALAVQLSQYLKEHHILALPIIYPAVEKNMARVRLFVNCLHSEEQIYHTVDILKKAYSIALNRQPAIDWIET